MKKFLVLGLAIVLFSPQSLYAASIGGAETLGQGKFAVGFDQEFGFKREMKHHKSSWEGYKAEDVEIKDTYRSMGKISYGIIDNIDVYAKLGAANFDLKQEDYYNDVHDGKSKLDGKYAFAYGFGLKGTHNFQDGWLVGLDAQFLSHKNNYKGKWTSPSGSDEESFSGKMTVYEWHVAPYVGKKIDNFTIYAGGKYSDLRTKVTSPAADGTLKHKAKYNFGVFAGLDIKMIEHVTLNVEGRFIDETAMSAGLSYKF
jgi:opacity protein-like surface antigen